MSENKTDGAQVLVVIVFLMFHMLFSHEISQETVKELFQHVNRNKKFSVCTNPALLFSVGDIYEGDKRVCCASVFFPAVLPLGTAAKKSLKKLYMN